MPTEPSEVVRVLVDRSVDPAAGAGLPAVRAAHAVGRPHAPPRRARQRRSAGPVRQRHRLRRRGCRPVPHRAHVLRRRQDRPDARDDPRGDGRRSGAPRWPSCCRCSAPTSKGIFRVMARAAGHHPHDRSAAARVPAARRGGTTGAGAGDGDPGRARSRACRGVARVQPDARLPRLPPRHHLSRDHRDAGARHLRGGGERHRGGWQGAPGGDDPARRARQRAAAAGGHRPSRRRGRDAGKEGAAAATPSAR